MIVLYKMSLRTYQNVDEWLHGDDLKEGKIQKVWAKNMRIHTIATYTVQHAVDTAVANIVRKISAAELTDSESDGTVGSDSEYEYAVDAEWDLVAI